jgi:hypothetical protein
MAAYGAMPPMTDGAPNGKDAPNPTLQKESAGGGLNDPLPSVPSSRVRTADPSYCPSRFTGLLLRIGNSAATKNESPAWELPCAAELYSIHGLFDRGKGHGASTQAIR